MRKLRIPAAAMMLAATVLATALTVAPAHAESAADAARRKVAESRSQLALPPPADTKETSESYEVGANFRGTIKKSFHNLGTGTLSFRTIARDRFSVKLEAKVKHPQTQEQLECRVQREYKLDGKDIRKVSEDDWFNTAAQKHRKRFVDCVALGYMVKWFSPADVKPTIAGTQPTIPPLKFNLDNQTYEITYLPGNRWLEATLRSGEGIVGRFFLQAPQGGVRPVDKFRIHAKDDLVVSFVRTGLEPGATAP